MKQLFERARKPEQIELRRKTLLETTKNLLEKSFDLNSLSLNKIAKTSGMAKANIYRYFETREALFLALLWNEWQNWFTETQKTLNTKGRAKKIKFELLIQTLAGSLAQKKLLCALTAALPSVLENNLSAETIREFKIQSLLFFGEIAMFLESKNPDLNKNEYALFLQDTVSLITGLYPFTEPPKVVAKVISDPQLHFYKRQLTSELSRYMLALAINLKNSKHN